MKIPEQFLIRISTNDRSLKGTYSNSRIIKDLLEKAPITFSYARSLYSGGRYSYSPEFTCTVKEILNYADNIKEVILIFKHKKNEHA